MIVMIYIDLPIQNGIFLVTFQVFQVTLAWPHLPGNEGRSLKL